MCLHSAVAVSAVCLKPVSWRVGRGQQTHTQDPQSLAPEQIIYTSVGEVKPNCTNDTQMLKTRPSKQYTMYRLKWGVGNYYFSLLIENATF